MKPTAVSKAQKEVRLPPVLLHVFDRLVRGVVFAPSWAEVLFSALLVGVWVISVLAVRAYGYR